MLTIRPQFGSPVSGDRFFPRSYPVTLAVNTIEDGGSIALFGPRRTGKSSILKETARLLEAKGLLPVEIDLQGRSGPSAFAGRLIAKIPKDLRGEITTAWTKLGGLPTGLLEIVKKADVGIPTDSNTDDLFREYWEALSDVVQEQAARSPKRIVLILDELPYFCEQMIERGTPANFVDDFLATLRRWRQQGLSMAIAGSIGMRHVLRTHGLDPDHLNDLTPVPLLSLTNEEAKAMIAALAAGANVAWWKPEHSDAILAEAPDNLPSYIQSAFAKVRALTDPTPAQATEVIRRDVRYQFESGFFDQFDKRLGRYKDDAPRARAVLESLAAKQPKSRTELVQRLRSEDIATDDQANQLLASMIEDGFIAPSGQADGFGFAYRMVETWWRRKTP